MAEAGSADKARAKKKDATPAAGSEFTSPDEVDRALTRMVGDADRDRAAGLDALTLVYRARARVMGRLIEQHGGEQAKGAAATLLADWESVARDLRTESVRAASDSPMPSSETSIVHGHVLDDDRDPVPDATVELLDVKGAPIDGTRVTTDDDGYFTIEWPTGPRGADSETPTRLRVTSEQSGVLHEERQARVRSAGEVEYIPVAVGTRA